MTLTYFSLLSALEVFLIYSTVMILISNNNDDDDAVEQEMASRSMRRVAQRTTSMSMRSAEASGVCCTALFVLYSYFCLAISLGRLKASAPGSSMPPQMARS